MMKIVMMNMNWMRMKDPTGRLPCRLLKTIGFMRMMSMRMKKMDIILTPVIMLTQQNDPALG